jgi:hypothetical protein
MRLSAAATNDGAPSFEALRPAISAEVPAFSEPPTSAPRFLLDCQRRADDAGILAILKGCGRGEVDGLVVFGLVAGQAVARRLDRHGDRILVPVGHRAFALGLAAKAGREPFVRIVDRLAVEPQARQQAPKADDADHSCLSSDYPAGPPAHERLFICS